MRCHCGIKRTPNKCNNIVVWKIQFIDMLWTDQVEFNKQSKERINNNNSKKKLFKTQCKSDVSDYFFPVSFATNVLFVKNKHTAKLTQENLLVTSLIPIVATISPNDHDNVFIATFYGPNIPKEVSSGKKHNAISNFKFQHWTVWKKTRLPTDNSIKTIAENVHLKSKWRETKKQIGWPFVKAATCSFNGKHISIDNDCFGQICIFAVLITDFELSFKLS